MIPLLDLKAQFSGLRDEILPAIIEVLESGRYVLGPEVERFEEEFARYIGTGAGVGMNSGTSALHMALLALDIGPGDEVITSAHTFVATVAAIRYTGAIAVLVDIDPQSYTMAPESVAQAVTDRTRALIPVHLYGQPADMEPLLDGRRCSAGSWCGVQEVPMRESRGYRMFQLLSWEEPRCLR